MKRHQVIKEDGHFTKHEFLKKPPPNDALMGSAFSSVHRPDDPQVRRAEWQCLGGSSTFQPPSQACKTMILDMAAEDVN